MWCPASPAFQDDIDGREKTPSWLLGGRYTAVRKKAKAGDSRVQDDFEYTSAARAHPGQMQLAGRAMAACAMELDRPIYGRVDMVRGNDGRHAIMESS
jgi:hypothetical protein